jgi:PKD repeat protein/subtilisin family serine protease
MTKNLLSFLLSLTVFAFFQAFGQNRDVVLLTSGTIEVPVGHMEISKAEHELSEYQNRNFVYLHFEVIPSAVLTEQLRQEGVILEEYLPHNSYRAIFEKNVSSATLSRYYADAVMIPQAKWKMAFTPGVDFPQHAVQGSDLLLNVSYSKQVSRMDMEAAFLRAGAYLMKHHEELPLVRIRATAEELDEILDLPFVYYAEPIDPEPTPENLPGKTLHRSSYLDNPLVNSTPYTGKDVWVALGDDGNIGPHVDYKGRTDQSNVTGTTGDHGDHIAGTIMGAGNVDPSTRGMAFESNLQVWNVWDAVNNSPSSHINPGVMVTSTSYSNGCNAGYTSFAQTADQQVYSNPGLMHVFSAGNSGTSDCGYGAGNLWGNVTGGVKIGKNVLAVGSLSNVDVLVTSSSRGPAHDGRIKPEVCAQGSQVYSTEPNNTYGFKSGTSMACPGVSGTYAQLVQAYRELNSGANPPSALLKSALMNTADDLGNHGPDFKHGFGRINGRKAAEVLENYQYFEDTISTGDSNLHVINIPGNTKVVKIMLYWNDVPASVGAAQALVNDLDLTVTDPSNGIHLPFVLNSSPNPTLLDLPALHGADHLNNMEQVEIINPPAGTYTIRVKDFNLPTGTIGYHVNYTIEENDIKLVYPVGGESFTPGQNELIRWDASDSSALFTMEYSIDSGATWTLVNPVIPASQRYFLWSVPNVVTGKALVRISRGAQSSTSVFQFSIIGVPQNLNIPSSCPNEFDLTWNAVTGATHYEISVLGPKYMDSVMTTTNTFATVMGVSAATDTWVSVKALTADATGQRAIAIEKPAGIWNCIISNDLSLDNILQPSIGIFTDCTSDTTGIEVEVSNAGLVNIDSTVLVAVLNGTDSLFIQSNQLLLPGASQTLLFNGSFNLQPGINELKILNLIGDDNPLNDTLMTALTFISGTTISAPYFQDFESFSNCGTSSNCEQEICNLSGGWVNLENGRSDSIDFRVDDGGTSTNNSGPSFDHNPGTIGGKYLYTEASGGCEGVVASMITPCIDLSGSSAPEASIWYHMYGSDMGELHVDLFDGNSWIIDVVPAIIGDQGNVWQQLTIPLTAYVGDTVIIQFRGITGNGFTSDLALDDFQLIDTNLPPLTEFESSSESTCPGVQVDFIDLSSLAPTSWTWDFSPNTYSYVGGTNSNSQNPSVLFTDTGNYTVTLVASNINGSDTLIKAGYIEVLNGDTPTVIEDFEVLPFPSEGWIIENPDGSISWERNTAPIVNSNGIPGFTAFVQNFAYNAAGEEDGLSTKVIDLIQSSSATLYFDVSYRRYNANYSDGLRIDVSTDCGSSFIPSVYQKSGSTLATGPDWSSSWIPTSSSDWRTDSLDLSAYVGSSVQLMFVNECGYGNNLYLDNIRIEHEVLITGEVVQPIVNQSVRIYPNPGNNHVNIYINGYERSEVMATVYDARGAVQSTSVFSGNAFDLDTELLSRGLYFIIVEVEETTHTFKWIKL